jgi:hypothetical protein
MAMLVGRNCVEVQFRIENCTVILSERGPLAYSSTLRAARLLHAMLVSRRICACSLQFAIRTSDSPH